MRRAIVVAVFALAGLAPLLRYHPDTTTRAVPAPPPSTGVPAPPAGATGSRAVNGSIVDTEFGPYQVQVTLTGNRITDVNLITTPRDRRSQRIANGAAPTLRREALQAQNAHIDTVSGATATSEAYAQSLQAAIDASAKGN